MRSVPCVFSPRCLTSLTDKASRQLGHNGDGRGHFLSVSLDREAEGLRESERRRLLDTETARERKRERGKERRERKRERGKERMEREGKRKREEGEREVGAGCTAAIGEKHPRSVDSS